MYLNVSRVHVHQVFRGQPFCIEIFKCIKYFGILKVAKQIC